MYKFNNELHLLDRKIVKASLFALPYSIFFGLGLLGVTTKANIQLQQLFSYQHTSEVFLVIGAMGLLHSLMRTITFGKRKKDLIELRDHSLRKMNF